MHDPLAQTVTDCRCKLCRALDGDPGPPITDTQRQYCDLFVAWFRANDRDREPLAVLLELVGRQVRQPHSF